MKRKGGRLLTWAFGIAVAIGFIMPAAVQTASAATGSAGNAVSQSTPAASHCVGTRKKSARDHDVKLVFWYTIEGPSTVCIGTVRETVHYRSSACKTFHARVYHRTSPGHWHLEKSYKYRPAPNGVCGSRGANITHNYHVNRTFPLIAKVCVGADHTHGYPCAKVS